jgi:hypothetical protein
MENNASVGVVGGWSLSGGSKILNFNTGQNLTPQKISAPADPLTYVTAPSTAGLTLRSMTPVNYTLSSPPPGNTMQPGIYCGGFSASGGASFTMASGIYYIAGGGFSISGGATISGTGITIYTTSGPNSGVPGCNAAFQPFAISGTSNLNLSAPTSGALEAMLIFQDRSINSGSTSTISGGSSLVLSGSIYLLHSPLAYSGGSSSSSYTILVADKLTMSGGSTINANYTSLKDGSPVKNAAPLAE